MKNYIVFFSYFILVCFAAIGQPRRPIDKVKFFTDEQTIKATLIVPMKEMLGQKKSGKDGLTARFIATLPDSTRIDEKIALEERGHFRKEYCMLPPLKLSFSKSDSSVLYPLKSLKLVSFCRNGKDYENFLFKEFLVYKMFNLLTEKSFRVRLLEITFIDDNEKKKPLEGYAFLIEDMKELAKRNGCSELKEGMIYTEAIDREQMTLVAIFEYMIGNTDWSVPVRHNIKIMQPGGDAAEKPFAIPYDFDYAGLVNTNYAVPHPTIGTESVLERVYRGFPRNMDELQIVFDLFNNKKQSMFSLVSNFELLPTQYRETMINYMEEFYKLINDTRMAESVFVKNARKE